MIAFAAAFVLGLASSGHCAAMCGPLMVAWRQQAAGARGAGGIALYHLSRIAVYAVLGVVAGLAGQALSGGGFARGVSIASGLVLIAMALGRVGVALPGRAGVLVSRALGRVMAVARLASGRRPAWTAMLGGALNALLPCGLLYAALAGSAAVADPVRAALAMALYGLGTTPALVGIWWSAGALVRVGRARLALVTPVVLAITGLLLIGRGVTASHDHAAGPDSHAVGHAHGAR